MLQYILLLRYYFPILSVVLRLGLSYHQCTSALRSSRGLYRMLPDGLVKNVKLLQLYSRPPLLLNLLWYVLGGSKHWHSVAQFLC